MPGLAKTTAAKAISDAVDVKFARIQCTPDLLPGDIIGTQIYNQATGKFENILGPVFANFVLLDEVNRSSAKTQSAMLEAMQEKLQENRKQSMKENMENQKMMDKWSGYDGDNTIHDENYDWEAKTW